MAKRLLGVVAWIILTPTCGGAASPNEFAAPPANLLFQLQKQNHARPWLRVTTDSSRLTLRVRRMDESGLGGISWRKSDPSAPSQIGWHAIARIDEPVTRARAGKTAGFLLGGALGAGLGKAIGESIRSNQTDPQPPHGTISTGHGGKGIVLGLAVLGGLGAWQGGRFGDRMVKGERSWYVAVPREASSRAAVATSAETTPLPTVETTPGQNSPAAASPRLSPSPSVLRACGRIGRDDLIRMRGDFGQFEGLASVVGPEGMEGLRVDPDRGRLSATSALPGLITWDRIHEVDKRGSSWRKGAVIGGLALGAAGGYIGYIAATEGLFDAHQGSAGEAVGLTAYGFGVFGAAGAVLGAGVGRLFPAWRRVYVRPEAGG